MKYLFLAIVALLAWWVWRRARQPRPPQNPPASQTPQDMVSCVHCGLHLPHGDAVTGMHGPYCSAAHRSAAGDRNPD
ncbi:MAG: PP0621 family protein [Limnohabitans sp.]|jgi:uncharacterized protein